jgi:hypothetical protein
MKVCFGDLLELMGFTLDLNGKKSEFRAGEEERKNGSFFSGGAGPM